MNRNVFTLVLGAIAAYLLVLGVVTLVQQVNDQKLVSATATVSSVRSDHITVDFTHAGKSYTASTKITSSGAFTVGSSVTVYFQDSKPTVVYLLKSDQPGSYLSPVSSIVSGCFLAGLAAYFFFQM